MEHENIPVTIYLEEDMHEVLQRKATEQDCSVSDLIRNAVKHVIIEERRDGIGFDNMIDTPVMSDDEMFTRLQEDGWLF